MPGWSEALAAFRRGDLAATDRITALVGGYLWRMGGDDWTDAHDDLVQEVLIALLESGPSATADGAVVAFIRTTTRRKLVDLIRRERGRKRADPGSADGVGWRRSVSVEAAGELRAEDEGWELLTDPSLQAAVAALDERERQVLAAKYGEELTDREGAERLGFSLSTFQRTCREALRKLGGRLRPGPTPAGTAAVKRSLAVLRPD